MLGGLSIFKTKIWSIMWIPLAELYDIRLQKGEGLHAKMSTHLKILHSTFFNRWITESKDMETSVLYQCIYNIWTVLSCLLRAKYILSMKLVRSWVPDPKYDWGNSSVKYFVSPFGSGSLWGVFRLPSHSCLTSRNDCRGLFCHLLKKVLFPHSKLRCRADYRWEGVAC